MKLHYLDLQAGRLEGFNGFLPSRPRMGDFIVQVLRWFPLCIWRLVEDSDDVFSLVSSLSPTEITHSRVLYRLCGSLSS